jgi:pimeloyl-ACP methyl ester carboxylesterase
LKRHDLLFAVIALVVLVLGWRVGASHRFPVRDVVLEGVCRVPVRIISQGAASGRPSVIVLHGLGANQRVMEAIGQAFAAANMTVYLLDLPGHGNNTIPFSFQRAEACTVEAVGALERQGQIQLDKTFLVGHSMGGALAIRLADYFPAAATAAISSAPLSPVSNMPPGAILMGPPRRMPVNLLVIVGQFDFPFVKHSAEKLVAAAGGERFKEPGDFLQRRAVRLVTISGATHTSLIFDVSVWNLILNRWFALSLPILPKSYLFASFFWGPVIGLVGLAFLFPSAASGIVTNFRAGAVSSTVNPLSVRLSFRSWPVAGLFAVGALNFFMPLRFLRMYDGDYLASCLLLSGIVLCALLWSTRNKSGGMKPPLPWRAVAAGGVLGMAAMLAFSAWMNWALTDMWLNSARWMRFPVLLLACLPYAIAEEWALGAPRAGNWVAKIRRYLLFGTLRLFIWLSILFALYVYSNQQILLAVLVFYMGLFSLIVRIGADAVHRRTNSPAGAAVFTAILMAWFIAAVFPLT